MKTHVYIDGYNLFYGCLKHSNDKWLDIYKLFETIISIQTPQTNIEKVYFFTADIKAKVATHGQQASLAQQSYHRALVQTYPNKIDIIKGYYSLEKANLLAYEKPPNKDNRINVWRLEEKQSDVNIALTAYRQARKNEVEQLVFVSNDTDLVPALRAIKEDFSDKHIGMILPVRKTSHRPANKQLEQFADWTRRYITDEELANSHLPDKIPTKKKPILKPDYW